MAALSREFVVSWRAVGEKNHTRLERAYLYPQLRISSRPTSKRALMTLSCVRARKRQETSVLKLTPEQDAAPRHLQEASHVTSTGRVDNQDESRMRGHHCETGG